MLEFVALDAHRDSLCQWTPYLAVKAPRRPVKEVWSHNAFDRPQHATYVAKPAPAYPFFRIHNTDNPFAEWRPAKWGWDRIA